MNSRSIKYFTVVELLVVAGIIAILAGILIPTISSAASKGRETKARADMNSIKIAITQYETDYGTLPFISTTDKFIKVPMVAQASDDYDAVMELLTNCKSSNGNATTLGNLKKVRYLNPPAKKVQDSAGHDAGYYFLDPWGHRYNIALNTSYSGKLDLDEDFLVSEHSGKKERVLGKVAIYSYGAADADNADNLENFLFSWKNDAGEGDWN